MTTPWRRPGTAMGIGAALGAGLGAGAGALTADPDKGQSRGRAALAGGMLGAGLGAAGGASAANWSTARPPKTAPSPAAAGRPAAKTPSPTPEETHEVGALADEMQSSMAPEAPAPQFDPNAAYAMHNNGKPDVVRYIGTHPDHPEVPRFESLVRTRTGRPNEPKTFYPSAEDLDGEVHELMPHAELKQSIENAALAGQDHPVFNFISSGDPSTLNPIRKSDKTAEFWATKRAAIMSPSQYRVVKNTFDRQDHADQLPSVGAIGGASMGTLLGAGYADHTKQDGDPETRRLLMALTGTALGAGLGYAGGHGIRAMTRPPNPRSR